MFSIVSIISGARPRENCSYAAFAMFTISMLHLGYVVFVRPLRTLLDTAFSILNSLLLVTLTVTVAIVLVSQQRLYSLLPAAAVSAMEGCLWLLSTLGFVQLGVQGYWAYHVAQRRLHRQRVVQDEQEKSVSADDSSDSNDSTTSSSTTKESHNAPQLLHRNVTSDSYAKPLLAVPMSDNKMA